VGAPIRKKTVSGAQLFRSRRNVFRQFSGGFAGILGLKNSFPRGGENLGAHGFANKQKNPSHPHLSRKRQNFGFGPPRGWLIFFSEAWTNQARGKNCNTGHPGRDKKPRRPVPCAPFFFSHRWGKGTWKGHLRRGGKIGGGLISLGDRENGKWPFWGARGSATRDSHDPVLRFFASGEKKGGRRFIRVFVFVSPIGRSEWDRGVGRVIVGTCFSGGAGMKRGTPRVVCWGGGSFLAKPNLLRKPRASGAHV